MKIGGFLRFSLIDFPGRISAVVFTQGCNFRCPFCHNPELVLPRRFQLPLVEEEVMELLQQRFGKLDGVTITGGEPLLQPDLEEFLYKIKRIGYDIKLDTNGSYPGVLKKLINRELVDYLAMDVKAALANYPKVIDMPVNLDYIVRSMDIIRQSGLPYEFRTTIVKNLHTVEDIKEIAKILHPEDRYALQNFRPAKRVGHKDLPLAAFDEPELAEFEQILSAHNLNYSLR